MVTQIVHSDLFRRHDNIGHPENSERTMVMMQELEKTSFYDDLDFIDPKRIDEGIIKEVHSERMINQIKEISETRNSWLDLDTYVCKKDFETASLAAGSLLELCKNVLEGKSDNGFAIIRPPGHHATSNTSMGFCLFNNESLAAHQLAKNGKKILIIDPDVHHGNGVQDIFYDRKDVLYQSIHLSPHFPGTGKIFEIGEGEGVGYNVNAPLSYGNGEEALMTILDEIMIPIAKQFNPDLIIVASGFDGHHTDPLGGLKFNANTYGKIISKIQEIESKIVCSLEGGYNLKWIGKCLNSQLASMMDLEIKYKDETEEKNNVEPVISEIKDNLSSYWKI